MVNDELEQLRLEGHERLGEGGGGWKGDGREGVERQLL